MKHITKFILTIVVAFMLVEIFPVNKISADTTYEAQLIKADGQTTNYATIELAFDEANKKDGDKAVNKNCVVKLLKNCAIEEQLEVEKGAYFTLDLNGFTIDAQKKDRLIYINGFTATHDEEETDYVGHLIITDSSPDHTGALINGYRASNQKGGAGIEVLGQLHFMGGTIRNCRNEGYLDGQGAAIYVEGVSLASLPGYVLMEGNAKIENCYAEAEGGAVYLEEAARFRMDGGTITNCHAEIAGGAVFAFKNSKFELFGGSINNCNVNPNYDNGGAYDACGGGIFAFSGALIDMNGGEIKYCTAKNGGGIYLKQGFKDIDDKYFFGSQGFLEGGTISNNRATAHGGGVFVQTGDVTPFAPYQTAILHLNGGVVIDNNQGIELKDGPIKDNVYLELKMNSGTDGYRPYFYVDGNLTGRVGINADTNYYGQISFEQKVVGSQLDHLFSDDNGKVIEYRADNRNYLVKGHATILKAYLTTWSSDRASATVQIDKDSHSIRIYAARQKDLDTVFEPETVELIWRGGRLKEEGTNGQTYYDNPHVLKIFGPANREEQRCYYQRVTVFDSREVGQSSYSETWDVRIYFQNSLDKLRLRTINTNVFKKEVEQYTENERWVKLEPDSKNDKGVCEFYLYKGTRLKLESINNDKEHQIFKKWAGGNAIQQAILNEQPQRKPSGPYFYNTDPIIEITLLERTDAKPTFQPIEKQYTVDVVNGYLNKDTSKTSLTTKAGETINAQFKAPASVTNPNSIRFVKWETSGNFKLDESIVNNENITFAMPEESFTLTGIYETKYTHYVKYYRVTEGVEPIQIGETEEYYEGDLVEKSVESKFGDIDFAYFKAGRYSDVSITTTHPDDGHYKCSFIMPNQHVDIYVHYINPAKVSNVRYYTVIDGVTQSDVPFLPENYQYHEGDNVAKEFNSTLAKGTKYFDKFTSDDVSITKTQLDNGNYQCSFVMPGDDVDIYAHYISNKYELAQVNTTEPGMTLLSAGTEKNITAATAPEGMVFDRFELSSNGAVITDETTIRKIVKYVNNLKQKEIKIVMPSYNLTVTAKYKRAEYTLRQINTSDSGDSIHNEGDVVVIKYDEIPNYTFKNYKYRYLDTGETITDPESVLHLEELDAEGKIIRITMPNSSIVVEAVEEYTPVYHKLIQIATDKEGITKHLEGSEVSIVSKSGKIFTGFVFYEGIRPVDESELDITYITDNYIILKMPNYDLTVIALYEHYPTIKYTLTQVDTMDAGSNYYAAGTENISIDSIDFLGGAFTHFDFYKEDKKLEGVALGTFISEYVSGSVDSGHIKLKMPNYNLKVVANYDSPSIDEYPLTQINTYNEGTARYKQGTEGIHIKALDIIGYEFNGWKFSSNGEEIITNLNEFLSTYVTFTEDTNEKEFDLTMPPFELTVEALFTIEPESTKYTLVEENTVHSGTSQYHKDTKVDIQALSLIDKQFDKWEFYKLDDGTPIEYSSIEPYIVDGTSLGSDRFTLKMPAFNLKVVAKFKEIDKTPYKLIQINTIQEGKSIHYEGTKINIRALEIPGYSFDKWKFYNGTKENPIEIKDIIKYVVDDLNDDHFTLIMPRIDGLIVEATFKDEPMIMHNLRQINTVDEGSKYHYEGEKIKIEALRFEGEGSPTFKEWKFYDCYEVPIPTDEMMPYISGNITTGNFVLTMPNFDLIVEATYESLPEDTYDLTQINTCDTGTKSYYAGTKVTISAFNNEQFTLTGWKFYDENEVELTGDALETFLTEHTNPKAVTDGNPVSAFILTMPNYDLTVKAVYNTTPPETMYTLTQIKTVNEGIKSYYAGTKDILIKALNIQGYDFSGWKFYKDGEELSESTSPTLAKFKEEFVTAINPANLKLTMPAYNLTVEAVFERSPDSGKYTLTTENTTYDGAHMYYSGTKVDIEALTLKDHTFNGWKFYAGTDKTNEITGDNLSAFVENYVLGDVTQDEIVLIMPSQNIYVEATYNGTLPDKYELTQIKTVSPGTVSYYEGTKVHVEAAELVYGTFKDWKFSSNGVTFTEDTEIKLSEFINTYVEYTKDDHTEFTLTMPAYNLTIEALYDSQHIEPHKLTTIDASPAGVNKFYADTEIEVKAYEKAGKIFDHFKVYKQDKELTGTDLTNFIATNVISKGFDSGNFTLKMPNYDLTIQSIYREPVVPTPFNLEQVKTINEGISQHLEGAHVSIQAQKINGSIFNGWKFYYANGSEIERNTIKEYVIGDITSDRFTLVMPNYDLKVEATFISAPVVVPHDLKQINTIDEGVKSYYAGTRVRIIANDYGTDATFVGWKFYNYDYQPIEASILEFDQGTDLSSTNIVLHMPDYHLIVEATYSISPVSTPHKLTLIGTYNEGVSYLYKNEIFSARRLDVTNPIKFVGWEIYKNDVLLTESTNPKLSEFINSQLLDTSSPKTLKDSNLILMPNYDLTIKAIYKSGSDPVVWHKLEQVYTVDEGSSMHQKDETIDITAITPPNGSGYENNGFKYYKYVDDRYVQISKDNISFVSESDSAIRFVMPDYDLKVVAQFKPTTPKYVLTAISTSLNGNKEVVSLLKKENDSIEALPKGTGTFEHWLIYNSDTLEEVEPTGKAVDDTSHKLTFKMPAKNITIVPIYDSDYEDFYWIDVINGYANGEPFDINYKGTDIIVEASEYDGGQFTNWKVYKYKEVEHPVTKSVLLSASPETETDPLTEDISNNMTELAKLGITNINQLNDEVLYIHQPEFDIELEAKYETDRVRLTVVNGIIISDGSSSKEYPIGAYETIKADPSPNGKIFARWNVLEGNPVWIDCNRYSKEAKIKLVDDVKVEAEYILKPPYVIPPTGVK